MDKKRNRNIDIISSIDEEIIDRNTKRRSVLFSKVIAAKRKKRNIMTFVAAAASFLIIFSFLLPFLLPTGPIDPTGEEKQIPIYQGMTISGVNPTQTAEAYTPPEYSAAYAVQPLSAHSARPGAPDAPDRPFGDGKAPIDEAAREYFATLEIDEEIYYAKPGEDIYITIHFSNPDDFEIVSFTLNGDKYSSYMFEYGSDMENIILKKNVGDAAGIVEYTIDSIKYIDQTEIKDVIIDGNKTVSAGVYREEKLPRATVEGEKVRFDGISFDVYVADELGLVGMSDGELRAVLYDGDTIISAQELEVGKQTSVSFEGLLSDKTYQYAILGSYDALDGEGPKLHVLYEKVVTTDEVLSYEILSISKSNVSFSLGWAEDYPYKEILKITLYGGDETRDIPVDSREINDLLSDTEYVIEISYKAENDTLTKSFSFVTRERIMPTLEFTDPMVSKSSVDWDISVNDVDAVGAISGIELILGDEVVCDVQELTSRGFDGLFSNTEYKIRVTYTYDLLDGAGERTLSVEKSFKTLVKSAPSFEFAEPTVAHNYVLWGVVINDEDAVGAISKIELLSENQVVRTESDLSARSFSGLLSDKEYKIRVTYTYDLNDRAGAHTLQKTLSFRTVERPMPSVDVSYNYIKLRSVSFDVTKIDEADIALIENVELYLGDECIAESDSLSVTFDGLAPATEYRIVVTYSFDMGDGYGTRRHYLEFRFKTKFDFGVGEWSQSEGLEINRNGVVTGIGTCEDKVIFIEGATAIGAEAFEYSDIEALYLVDCDRIYTGAFAYCDRLESVIFAGNTSFIGRMAFFECEALERLEFYGGVVEIGESSFECCSALTAVDLPNNLKIIRTSAFGCCSSLKNMTFPDSLVEIGYYAFERCAFERIELPEKMNYISSCAFEACTLLKSIKLPKEMIGWSHHGLFRYCHSLESVVIPAGEGDFGPMDLAFTGCTSLRSVYIRGNVTRIADRPIEDIHYYFEMERPPLDFDERWLDADNVTWGYDFSNIE